MALEFDGPGAEITNQAVEAIVQLRVAQAALERLTDEQMEETYRGLLAAMVLSAETNDESPAIQDGKPAAWYSEFTAAMLVSGSLVQRIDRRHPYEHPPRSHQLYEEAQARYSPKQLVDSGFSFTGSVISDLF